MDSLVQRLVATHLFDIEQRRILRKGTILSPINFQLSVVI